MPLFPSSFPIIDVFVTRHSNKVRMVSSQKAAEYPYARAEKGLVTPDGVYVLKYLSPYPLDVDVYKQEKEYRKILLEAAKKKLNSEELDALIEEYEGEYDDEDEDDDDDDDEDDDQGSL